MQSWYKSSACHCIKSLGSVQCKSSACHSIKSLGSVQCILSASSDTPRSLCPVNCFIIRNKVPG